MGKVGLIYSVALIVVIMIIITINKKLKAQEKNKKTKIEKKQEEVEMLKLDVEKEILENKLKEMKEPTTKYCPYCGATNDAKATRCTKCGVGFGKEF